MYTGSANVSAGAIDVDDTEAMEAAGFVQDASEGSQDGPTEVPEIIREAQSKGRGRTKGSTSKPKVTDKQKAAAAAKKAKEAEKKREAAKKEREAKREAAKKEREAAKDKAEDLTALGFVDPKSKITSTLRNVPLELLDGIDGGDPVDRQFVDNVKLHGRIFEPILVRGTEDGRFNIIAGKRRAQAARANEFPTIPAVVESGDLSNDFVIGLTENHARSNNIIEEYRMVTALVDHYREQMNGDTGADDRKAIAAIAKATGMTVAQVKKSRNLGRLVPELMTAVEEGRMASWSAQHASRMPVEVQRSLVDKLESDEKITVDDINVARRHRQHEAVRGIVDGATESGQDAYDVPDNDQDETADAAAPATTRVQKVARIVNLSREALALAQSLSSRSADEDDAITFLTQIVENLTSPAS